MKTVRADLHNHFQTTRNPSRIDFNQLVDIASRRLGEGGVLGVTNFNEARIVGGRYERIIDDRYEKIVQKKGY